MNAADALAQIAMPAPGAPWWFTPALVVGIGCLGGWVAWEFVKRTARNAMDGRKPPNSVSIVGGALTSGALSYAAGNLMGLGLAKCALYALVAALLSPIAFPILVLALAVAAENLAGAGWGQRVRTTLMGRERDRRVRARERTFVDGKYPAHDRRAEPDKDITLMDKTQAWWNG